jgi:hypothetical protein
MTRREVISLLGGAAAEWPLATRAQQPERMRRIFVLMGTANDAEAQARAEALQQGLQVLGWTWDEMSKSIMASGAVMLSACVFTLKKRSHRGLI